MVPFVHAPAVKYAKSRRLRLSLAQILAAAVVAPCHAVTAADAWEGDFQVKGACSAENASASTPSRYSLSVRQLSSRYFGFHFVACQTGTQSECEMTGVGRRSEAGDQLAVVSLVGGTNKTCKASFRRGSTEIVLEVREGCSDFCSANGGADGIAFIVRPK
jgi:hypothetical protein